MLEAKNISKVYGGEISLQETSLAIQQGQLVGLFGENGSGKSTLVRILALAEAPTSGNVIVFGRDPFSNSDVQIDDVRRGAIEYIPQGNLGLLKLSAESAIIYHLTNFDNVPRNEARRLAHHTLDAVGLDRKKYKRKVGGHLSGGEEARVAIAKAIALGRPICLADEVLAALDPESRIAMMRVLRSHVRRGATVVLIAHAEDIEPHFDRVIRMASGRIISDKLNPQSLS